MVKAGKKKAVAPKLRFPEFAGQALSEVRLSDVTAESSIRNGDGLPAGSVMGVSKVLGIVPMEERIVASDIARYKLVRKDWFAYNPMRLNIGSIARWHGDADILVSPDYVVFQCRDDPDSGIEPSYLDYFWQSDAWDACVREGGDGGVRVRIYYKDIARLELALPERTEQQEIADCLSSLDELIATQGRKVEALKTYKRGLMRQLFPREGETLPRLRFPEFKDAGEWVGQILEELSKSISSGKDKAAPDGAFDLYGSTGIIGKTNSLSYSGIYLLVARVGANAGLLTKTAGEFGVTDNTLVIILKPQQNIDFVFYYLDQIGLNKMIFGSGQPLITGGQLKALNIQLPNEEKEQQRIASCLTNLDAVISAETQKLKAFKTHKKGLMQQLFPSLDEAPQ